ncbi:MAG: septal ring lytic transglycosylase RlpA family protein, partial [Treponema sp.]|nr:septal ring lytic transglycosylase RlpA family protein [Treponema sp.]
MRKTAFVFIAILSLFSAAFAEDLYKSDVEASFYAEKFDGHTTASGEVYNMNDFTAAHKVLPFGTVVKVTNLANGKSVDVRINDRGPFIKGREIDVSKAAAVSLGMMMDGTARVSIQIVKLPESTLEAVATEDVKDEPVVEELVEAAKEEILEEDKNVDNKHWDIQVGAFSKAKNA